ncbi:protein MTRR-1, isoform b, partial [Pavlovales sp. CCMP2436]
MYGTQTGNSRGIANQLSDELKKASFDAPVAGLDQFKKLSLHEEDYVVIVCSTTGNGDAPENAEAFVRFVKNKKTAPGYFSKMSYSILGIGDTNYDQYQAIPRVIDLNLARLGAQRIIPKVETDEAT